MLASTIIIPLVGLALMPLSSASPLPTTANTTSAHLSPRFPDEEYGEWNEGPIQCGGQPIYKSFVSLIQNHCQVAIDGIMPGNPSSSPNLPYTWYEPDFHDVGDPGVGDAIVEIPFSSVYGQCLVSLRIFGQHFVPGLPLIATMERIQLDATTLLNQCLLQQGMSEASVQLSTKVAGPYDPSGYELVIVTNSYSDPSSQFSW